LNDTAGSVRLSRQRHAARQYAPFVSILVPVRNEATYIEETLDWLLTQDYDPQRYEILVADGRSGDATRQLVAAIQEWRPQVILLDNPRQWSSAGRNAGVRVGRGDLFVLIDGHCELDNPHYLTDLVDAFERSGADCIGRPQPLQIAGATFLQRAIATARTSALGHHPDSHIYSNREGFVPPQSVAVAYRRSVFDKVGLFDESFDACEDVEFNHRVARAGLRCFLTPRAEVRYVPRDDLPALFRQMVRYGRGRVRLLRKHPETFTAPGFVPAALLAGIVAGPLLAWWLPILWWIYGGLLGMYAGLVFAFSGLLARQQREPRMAVVLPLVFPTIHVGAGWGMLSELLWRRAGRPPAEPAAQDQWPLAA
jgi:succinoglycan biosynthesis protein ExoA